MTKNFRKVLSILLALSLVLGLCPDAAKAVGFETKSEAAPVESVEAELPEIGVELPVDLIQPVTQEDVSDSEEDPAQPENPEDAQAEDPEDPAQPEDPQEPAESEVSEQPEEPAQNETPAEVVEPEEPEEPAQTEVTEEQPAKQVVPVEDVKPSEEAPVLEKQGLKIGVSVKWDDMNNADGIRPDSIEVQLFAGESAVAGVKTLTLSAANGWTGYWEDMPQYNNEGQEILYRVAVVETAVMSEIEGTGKYSSVCEGNAKDGFVITSTHDDRFYLTPVVPFIPLNPIAKAPNAEVNADPVRSAGSIPPHTKNITDNQDGTYTISLDIVGESEKKPNNINVIVIFDRSGSMTTQRMNAAKTAVNNLANSLFAYNTSSAPNTVQMALVDFSTTASSHNPVNTYADFSRAVNNLNANGGTNWEDALQEAANVDFGDNDQTFVVFVSDGNPTFRNTAGNTRITDNRWYNYDNIFYDSDGVYGLGSDNPSNYNYSPQSMQKCYDHAVDDAQALANKVTPANFFTIGAFGNVDRMEDLTNDAGSDSSKNYYSAADTAALNQAISDILAKIEMAGFADVEIDDGTTNQVTTSSGDVAELLELVPNFKYYRSGGDYGTLDPWADAPEAKIENGEVVWDLSSVGVLENGVRYTVTFDCYPSQTTYDYIAQLKNGDIKYTDLDPEIQKYIVDNGGGSYSLRTNTNAGIQWDDTRDEAGRQSSDYTNPDPVSTDAETLTAKKEWEGGDPDVDELVITILMDDDPFTTDTISKDNDWSTESFISVGIIKDGQVLPGAEGHDFRFAELGSEQYHWELESPVVHPMLIDGVKTMLILVDENHEAPSGADTYEINGKTYFADTSAAGLTAVNHRRSNLNLTKVVTGEDAPADATFPFTLTVNNSKASEGSASDTSSDYYVWFSIYDTKAGATVKDATVTGATPEDGNTGYYYAPSGTAITVEMKDGWNLRFTNLPSGTTYTFTEGTLPEGFAFNKAELTQGADSTFKGGQTTTGTIENTKTSYTVKYTNDYALTDLEITKVWVDADNQDGIRLTPDELKAKLTLSPAVDGKEPTVVDNGDGTYTITYTGLPRFNNGQEVTYTVTEAAIDGYTTTGSPAEDHGTITNTHTPEVISVTVVKEWDDSDDIGGIRPTSISAQLTADGTASGDPVTLNAGNQWTYTWENLPKFKNGTEIVYSADETAVPAGYTKTGPEKTTAEDGTITFTVTNTYTPTPVKASFPVKKIMSVPEGLTGPDWTYTISVVANDGAPEADSMSGTVTKAAATVTFGDFEFTMPGTYTYTVSETGTYAGVTNDKEAAGKTVTITVKDDGKGNLVATVSSTNENPLTFTNTYAAEPTTASFPVEKELVVPEGLDGPEKWSYTINVEAEDGAPEAKTMTGTVDQDNTTVTFGEFEFTKPGTYTYTVSETGEIKGVTNDKDAAGKTVTITVKDNGDGTLTATASSTKDDPLTFTNTYEIGTAKASFPVTKILEVPAGMTGPEKWSYNIAVTANAGAPAAETMTGTVDQDNKKITFGEFTFTKPGTYTYTVSETGKIDGVTNDEEADGKTVTITVKDNGDGTMTATVSPEIGITFTNVYDVEPTTASFPVKKVISVPEGLDGPTEWSYKITVVANGEAPEAETMTGTVSNENDTVTFGDFTFTEPGTYTYTVSEEGTIKGVTNDKEAAGKTVTIKVVDNGDGTLTATADFDEKNPLTFTNTYSVEPTTAKFPVEKILEVPDGLKGPEKWSYTINVEAKDGAPEAEAMTGTVDQDNTTVTFGDFTFTEPGTYTYTVSETGTIKGVTNDAEAAGKTVTITVKDNGDGTLTATASSTENAPLTFTNTYNVRPTTASFPVKKILTVPEGLKGPEKWEYTIDVTADNGAPKAAVMSGTVDQDNDTITFGDFTFSAPGKYTYTVSETGTIDGVTNDGEADGKTVTITVEDDGEGNLVATVSPSIGITFTNVYGVKPATAKFTVEKDLVVPAGLEGPAEWSYDIMVVALGNAPEADDKTMTATLDQDNTSEEFGTFTFTAPGKYTYEVTEDGTIAGVTNDKEATKTVTITVTDEGDGTLKAVVNPEDAKIVFTNTYSVEPTTASFPVEKILEVPDGLKGPEKWSYTINVEAEDGAPEAETMTGTVDQDTTTVTFGDFTFTEPGTYTYTVSETGEIKGVTNDKDAAGKTVTITVVDNGNGTLTATASSTKDEPLTFTNTYSVEPTKASFPVEKILEVPEGLKGPEKWSYTINVEAEDDAPEAETMTGTVDQDNTTVTFGDFEFTKPGTYTYTVSETGEIKGVTNDKDAAGKTVTIEVVDNGDGTLTATVSSTEENPLTFTNTYSVKPTTASFPVEKELVVPEGLDGPEKWSYTINVEAEDDAPEAETMTGTVDQDNTTVTFGDFTFTEPGTYTYTVSETGTIDGVTNDADAAGKTVTIKVVDNGDGTLTATVSSTEENPLTFTNTYSVKPTTAEIPVEKLLPLPEGWDENEYELPEDWNDLTGKFTFTLEGEDEETPLPEVTEYTNPDPDGGSVTFGDIEFTMPGTYTYTVTESGVVPGITNDAKASQTVTIEVVDNGDGTLTATVDPEAGISFTNTMDLIELTVLKIWDDNDNQDGKRPESISVTLFANDTKVKTVELNEDNEWQYTFTDLPEYQNGEEVKYTVQEEDGDFTEFYEASYAGLEITNKHEIIKIKVDVTKVWEDKDDEAGLRADTITVQLRANGEAYGDPVELSEENEWAYTWNYLDKYEAGEEIEYTIAEIDEIPGYVKGEPESEKDEEGNFTITITNTLVTPVTDDPPVQKEISKDTPETDDEFTFVLTPVSNTAGLEVSEMPMPAENEEGILTITASDGKTEFGTITFYLAGTYVYTISEKDTELPGYKYDDTVYTLTYEITQEGTEMKKVLTVTNGEGEVVEDAVYVFTNEYTAPPVSIDVTKVWEGEDDAETTRPESITVKLLADGKDTGLTLKLSEDNEWKGTFEELPAQKDGKEIAYTVEEVEIEFYTSTVSGDMVKGFTITNTCTYIKTGDSSNLKLWSATMAVSAAGIGFTLFRKKREEEDAEA